METESQAGKNGWRILGSLDAAKAGLLLYVLGMLTSGMHYARFNILALDFTRIQSIVLGMYVVGLYIALPATAVWLADRLAAPKVLRLMACWGIIVGFDGAIAALLEYGWPALIRVTLFSTALQILLFADWKSMLASVREHKVMVSMMQVTTRGRAAALGLLLCLHFSLFWFPHIPGNFGGGEPIQVQVFPKTPSLFANRFVASSANPASQVSMNLLYQTDQDVYFLENPSTDGTIQDYDVMRVTRDEIIRMDYTSKVWVSWR